jgi:hypothetical protein
MALHVITAQQIAQRQMVDKLIIILVVMAVLYLAAIPIVRA